MKLEDVLRVCMEQDARILQDAEPDKEECDRLRSCHLQLKGALERAGEDEISRTRLTTEEKRELLSEKQLLGIFHTEYDTVTALTTFTCFLLSREEGEKPHSRKYMADVKTLHQAVNTAFGIDPEKAKGCN
jgi:hypothetical protein